MALTQVPLSMTAAALGGTTMRNRAINGCCRVTQRGSATLSTSNQFGQVDRMQGSLSGTGLGGTLIQQVAGLASGMTYKRGVKFNDISFTSGLITFRHRIEALNTLDLSGNTVTVSAKIYHDYGSNATVSIGLRKPSASDNFTSASTVGADTAVTVSTGTTTTVRATYALGSTDADNGLEIVIYHESRTVSVKNFVIGDIELQLGSEVGPFERRPYGTELALCQRYFQVIGSGNSREIAIGAYWGTTEFDCYQTYKVNMRAAPTLYQTTGTNYYLIEKSGGDDVFDAWVGIARATDVGCLLYATAGVNGTAGFAAVVATGNANSYIAFQAEL